MQAEQTVKESVRARVDGIRIMAVPLGTHSDKHAVMGLTSFPWATNVFPARGSSHLPELARRMPDILCDGR